MTIPDLMVKNRSESNTERKAPDMGAMKEIHLETEELVTAVGTALQENHFDTFETAGDIADLMTARGWKSPTEVEVQRREMAALLRSLGDAAFNHGAHSEEAELAKVWILMKVIEQHDFSAEELGLVEPVPA